MNERSKLISKLLGDFKTRTAYIYAKISTLVPSQIRALRAKSNTPRQPDLAKAAEMHQSRISMLETAGANPTLATLSAIAAALRVGLKIEFVPFSEMLDWENEYSQDDFSVCPLNNDQRFLYPNTTPAFASSDIVASNPPWAFYRPLQPVSPVAPRSVPSEGVLPRHIEAEYIPHIPIELLIGSSNAQMGAIEQ